MTDSPAIQHNRPLPRVIAVANQKGGVGKTTTSVNLSACLAELGFRTLLIDLDPQGNASSGVGIETRGIETSIYDVLLNDVAIGDCVEPANVKNLFVVPANLDLAGAEIELVNEMAREHRLKRAIDQELDEFFGFGDKFVMAKFEEILNTKLIQANSLVIASHNQQLINKFCNRIIHLDKGKIIKDEQLNK